MLDGVKVLDDRETARKLRLRRKAGGALRRRRTSAECAAAAPRAGAESVRRRKEGSVYGCSAAKCGRLKLLDGGEAARRRKVKGGASTTEKQRRVCGYCSTTGSSVQRAAVEVRGAVAGREPARRRLARNAGKGAQ